MIRSLTNSFHSAARQLWSGGVLEKYVWSLPNFACSLNGRWKSLSAVRNLFTRYDIPANLGGCSTVTIPRQLFENQSVVEYWESFASHAFENTTQSVYSHCVLLKPSGAPVPATFCFSIRRDLFDLPSIVIGTYLASSISHLLTCLKGSGSLFYSPYGLSPIYFLPLSSSGAIPVSFAVLNYCFF